MTESSWNAAMDAVAARQGLKPLAGKQSFPQVAHRPAPPEPVAEAPISAYAAGWDAALAAVIFRDGLQRAG